MKLSLLIYTILFSICGIYHLSTRSTFTIEEIRDFEAVTSIYQQHSKLAKQSSQPFSYFKYRYFNDKSKLYPVIQKYIESDQISQDFSNFLDGLIQKTRTQKSTDLSISKEDLNLLQNKLNYQRDSLINIVLTFLSEVRGISEDDSKYKDWHEELKEKLLFKDSYNEEWAKQILENASREEVISTLERLSFINHLGREGIRNFMIYLESCACNSSSPPLYELINLPASFATRKQGVEYSSKLVAGYIRDWGLNDFMRFFINDEEIPVRNDVATYQFVPLDTGEKKMNIKAIAINPSTMQWDTLSREFSYYVRQ